MEKLMIEKKDAAFARQVILDSLITYGEQTINQVIKRHHDECVDEIMHKLSKTEMGEVWKSGVHHKQTHMNKHPAKMEETGMIVETGRFKGPSGRMEKYGELYKGMNSVRRSYKIQL